MNKNKIKHPFQVTDNFFDDFKNEMVDKLEKLPHKGRSRKMKFMLQFTKYAAIIILSFFLGRASMGILKGGNENALENEVYSIDEVMLQMSDEDITDYILEDSSIEI